MAPIPIMVETTGIFKVSINRFSSAGRRRQKIPPPAQTTGRSELFIAFAYPFDLPRMSFYSWVYTREDPQVRGRKNQNFAADR
jgi:hypothetical protein